MNNTSQNPTPETTNEAPKQRVFTPRSEAPARSERPDRESRRFASRAKKGLNSRRRGAGAKPLKKNRKTEVELDSKVILVRRVTRVVKGGKRMRFSALVVVGDGNGKVGMGLKKGLDYQDSVNKATKKAKQNLVQIELNEDGSLNFSSKTKHKSCMVFLKPAPSGTGVIAGGFLRPVLELAGVKNVYSKIIRSRNKIAGTQATFNALSKYTKNVTVK